MLTCSFLYCLWYQDHQVTSAELSMPFLGSILIGCSLGMFKKLAFAKHRASHRFLTAFVFFVQLTLLVMAPALKFPSLALQMRSLDEDPSVKSSYYDGRGEACIVFVCSGIVITFVFFALCNAVQHPKIPESLSNMLIGALPICLIAALDS